MGYLTISGVIFFTLLIASSVLAYLYPQNFSEIKKDISQDVAKMQGMTQSELFLDFLWSNTLSILILAVFGFTFGIGIIYILYINALRLGVIIAVSVSKYGVIWLLALIPNCIFEIPAILLSCALGFRIAKCLFLMLSAVTNRKRIPDNVIEDFKRTGREAYIILPVCIFLLIIAALAEVYVTPGWLEFLIGG